MENIADKQEDLKTLETKLKKLETSLQKEKEVCSLQEIMPTLESIF